jgi:hypothetical protein
MPGALFIFFLPRGILNIKMVIFNNTSFSELESVVEDEEGSEWWDFGPLTPPVIRLKQRSLGAYPMNLFTLFVFSLWQY